MASLLFHVSLLPLVHLTLALEDGYASCYGNYEDRLPDNSVACGLGDFIAGEDFTYTTAICSTWVNWACGSCATVTCDSGKTANMGCSSSPTTKVRVIDSLGNACGSGTSNHVFDISTVPFSSIVTEGGAAGTCSGEVYVKYESVSCSAAGLVSGGLKIGILGGQSDPWCPPFWFSNVGGAGGLYSVEVSSDGGKNWNQYTRNSGNGCRWDCSTDGGSYLGKSLSFRLELCSQDDLPSSCTASGSKVTLTDALPTDWCANGASPCDQNSWQLSQNFDDSVNATSFSSSASPTASLFACGLMIQLWVPLVALLTT
eukprot:TRINITY_DN96134_c0_g1_i1.p1 TRINITY_DN96134_c0_g1~~TRINITY_DN96134_c0_g1_i1.p1  ORF type:complete len:314 (+),score=27.09 TRINITY_DN96134_c0_g1_i1:119-1060(+)